MSSPVKFKESHEERNYVIVLIVAMSIIMTVFLVAWYYNIKVPDDKLMADWKIDIEKAKKQLESENLMLKTMNCSELKDAISSNKFIQEPITAQQKYIGMCT